MKKKVISVVISVCMALALAACGVTANTTAEVTDNTVVAETPSEEPEIAEPVSEDNTEPEIATVEPTEPEPEAAEPEEVVEDSETFTELTEEWAMNKLALIAEANQNLVDIMIDDNDSRNTLVNNAYRIYYTGDTWNADIETKDGFSLNFDPSSVTQEELEKINYIYRATIFYYYSEYINNENCIDFADYISSHNFDDFPETVVPGVDTNNYYMATIGWCDSLRRGELSLKNITSDINISMNEITMFDGTIIIPSYQCDLYMGGEDTGLKMLFDDHGNFLNFNDENAQIEFYNPFPEG